MNTKELIFNLMEIKKSLLLGGGVTDTVWMIDSVSETMADRIDYMLLELGVSLREIEVHQESCINSSSEKWGNNK